MASLHGPSTSTLRKRLDEALAAQAAEFRTKTRKDLKLSPPSIQQVLDRLATKYDPSEKDKEDQEGKTRALENVEITLNFLTKAAQVGLKIAAAASQSSPWADLCVNAVSYLVNIPGKIHKFYTRLAELFQEVVFFLRQFRTYDNIDRGGDMPDELLQSTCDLICGFIKVCAVAYKPIKDGMLKRIFRGLKVGFLDDDSGLQDALDDFAKLAQKQSQLADAITLEIVFRNDHHLVMLLDNQAQDRQDLLQIQFGVSSLQKESTQRQESKAEKLRFERLCGKLGVSHDVAIKAQLDKRRSISRNLLSSTGWWLRKHDYYTQWLDSGSNVDPILYIYGDPGTGKTSLIPTIVRDIDNEKIAGKQVISAVYIATEDGNEDDGSQRVDKTRSKATLSTALLSLALQLADNSRSYLRTLVESKSWIADSDLSDLSFENLLEFLNLTSGRKLPDDEGTFYMIISGVEPGQPLQELVSAVTRANAPPSVAESSSRPTVATVRLLLIGDESILPFSQNEPSPSLARISVQGRQGEPISSNAHDVERYIRREVKEDNTLRVVQEDHHDFFESLYHSLIRTARGSFSVIDNKLGLMKDEIENHLRDLDRLKIIAETDPREEEGVLPEKIFKDLATNLNQKDIEQINEVLKWTVWSCHCTEFNLHQLDAIVKMKETLAVLLPFSSSFRSKKRFQRLFKLAGGPSDPKILVHETLIGTLRKMSWDKLGNSSLISTKDRSISLEMKLNISDASVAETRRFFWDLCEQAILQGFRFDNTHTTDNVESRIHVNHVDATADILLASLDILNGIVNCTDDRLITYAVLHVPVHIFWCVTLQNRLKKREASLSFPKKDAIVSQLMDFFMNPKRAASRLKDFLGRPGPLLTNWIFKERFSTAMNEWLNPETILEIRAKNGMQFLKFLGENSGHCGFMRPLTLEIASQWLTNDEWTHSGCFAWVDGFLRRTKYYRCGLSSANNEPAEKTKDSASRPNPDISEPVDVEERISLAAEWVKSMLTGCKIERMWFGRLGLTYASHKLYRRATRCLKTALKYPGSNDAKIHEIIAYCYHLDQDFEKALRHMKMVVKLREKNEADADEHQGSPYQDALRKMAAWYAILKRPRQVFDYYDRLYRAQGKFDYSTCCDFLRDARLLQETSRARNLFQQIIADNRVDKVTGLVSFFDQLTDDSEAESAIMDRIYDICSMAKLCGHIEDVLDALKITLKDKAEQSSRQQAAILIAMGAAQYYQDSKNNEELVLGTWDEARKLLASSNSQDCLNLRIQISHQCAAIHYVQGKRTNFSEKRTEGRLLDIYETSTLYRSSFRATSLANYYCCTNRTDQARELMRDEMGKAINILTDEIPENDYRGYVLLARTLVAIKDPRNALAAWSLVKPNNQYSGQDGADSDGAHHSTGSDTIGSEDEESLDGENTEDIDGDLNGINEDGRNAELPPNPSSTTSSPEQKSITRVADIAHRRNKIPKGQYNASCDGACGIMWHCADGFWVCEVCPDTNFCDSCHEALCNDSHNFLFCHPEHSWIYVPPWSPDEDLAVGPGNVRVPTKTGLDQLAPNHGTYSEGKDNNHKSVREGEILTIREWLKRICKEWKFPLRDLSPLPPASPATQKAKEQTRQVEEQRQWEADANGEAEVDASMMRVPALGPPLIISRTAEARRFLS